MQLYYTGVNYLTENPEDINLCVDEHFVSAQLMITSEDGIILTTSRQKDRDSGYSQCRYRRCTPYKRSKSLERRGQMVHGTWKYHQ